MPGTIISLPSYPYTITIWMPFHFASKTNGKMSVFDDGSAYDHRTCKFRLEIPVNQTSRFTSFFADRNRGDQFNLVVNNATDFYPFGCDYKNQQTYAVKLLDIENQGQQSRPYLWHRMQYEMLLQTESPTLDVPEDADYTEKGTITFGDVNNIRFPSQFFDPKVGYDLITSVTRSGIGHNIYSGTDTRDTVFSIQGSKIKMAQIIDYIVRTARATPFSLVVPQNTYPFGYEAGDNKTFTVMLAQSKLEITHYRYDDFRMNLLLRMI